MSDHTHVFCPGCREDSDRLAALRDEIMTLQVVGAAVDLSYRRADATARAQLAEEMEARRSEREATTRLAESQHRYVAQVKQRDQQLAALREARQAAVLALDSDCMSLCDSNTSSAPCSCWPDRIDRTRRALLAPPAAEGGAGEPWERVASVIEWCLHEIEESPPTTLPTRQQRARAAYSAINSYCQEAGYESQPAHDWSDTLPDSARRESRKTAPGGG
jgi:multidrug efflux pump subunit AcrA (membrane-fusion protein)